MKSRIVGMNTLFQIFLFEMIPFLICENLLTESNSILKSAHKNNLIEFYASGSSSQRINGTIQKTKPEYSFDQIEKNYDWCSNCGRSKSDHPWLILGVKDRVMEISGYYLKSGCCSDRSRCCCYEEGMYCCECCLFSWSLQISNDNQTWKTIHNIEKDYEMRRCKEKTYKFTETHKARYVRLIQYESCYSEPPFIALNKIELIGRYDGSSVDEPIEFINDIDDDDVSIIGHVSKNRM